MWPHKGPRMCPNLSDPLGYAWGNGCGPSEVTDAGDHEVHQRGYT